MDAMDDRSAAKAPSLASSLLRGSLGFAAVGLAAFAVWAGAGKGLSARFGEGGFYAVVAAVFLGLSGLVLHPLVQGPKAFVRFMRIFVPAFLAYAGVW
ncbi:MAG TPA: hypothetical protein VKU80_10190, partial [Planctomycetota bacterium]|nr:hypothetical protein [Planctomycetota bacterium]